VSGRVVMVRIRGRSGRRGPRGLGGADSDADSARASNVLPWEVAVGEEAHPLCGERLKALSFRRGRGDEPTLLS
jgi:hypothetical protein